MKFAVVTGANKGIGYGIVEKLTQLLKPEQEWTIVLCARNEQLGQEATEKFGSAPVKVIFHQLDVTKSDSIERFAQAFKEVDILVNNAGIAFKMDATEPFGLQARLTLETNFWGVLNFTRAMLPNLRKDARVVHLSSTVALMTLNRLSEELYQKFTSPMTMQELEYLMTQFVELAEKGEHEAHGWPSSAYGVSKLGLSKMTFIMVEELKDDPRHIVMNACCPGFVDTDMTNHKGTKTIQDGADTPCYLATLPLGPDVPNGKHLSDRAVVEWKRS